MVDLSRRRLVFAALLALASAHVCAARLVDDGSRPMLADCSSYMASTGCGWTSEWNCPGQSAGISGAASDDGSQGYDCCCTHGLWQCATSAHTAALSLSDCSSYMASTGCGWTSEWNCPGESAGSSGAASDDGSQGYDCCCTHGLWQCATPAPTPAPSPAPQTALPPVVVHNHCNVSIRIRGISDYGNDACFDMTNCQDIGPQQSLAYALPGNLGGKAIFFSYSNFPGHQSCYGQSFCAAIEFADNARSQLNFDNQYSYSFPIALGFAVASVGDDLKLAAECPQANIPGCMDDGRTNCTSNAGRMDSCKFDYGLACPPDAWRLKTDPSDGHFWCVVHDGHIAVISDGMANPTAEQCSSPQGDWVCTVGENCDARMCSYNKHLVRYLREPNKDGSFRKLYVYDDPLDPNRLTRTLTNSSADIAYLKTAKGGGGKNFQRKVNHACMNQPPTQVILGDGPGQYVYPSQEVYEDLRVNGYRLVDPSRKFLDHAMTFEGDDSQQYEMPPYLGKKPVMMAGNVGIQCRPEVYGGAPLFDELHVTLC